MKGAVSAQKALQGSETETRELLGGTKEKSISLTRGHWFALQTQWFFTHLAFTIFDCLGPSWYLLFSTLEKNCILLDFFYFVHDLFLQIDYVDGRARTERITDSSSGSHPAPVGSSGSPGVTGGPGAKLISEVTVTPPPPETAVDRHLDNVPTRLDWTSSLIQSNHISPIFDECKTHSAKVLPRHENWGIKTIPTTYTS